MTHSEHYQGFVARVRIVKRRGENTRDRGQIQIPVDLVEYLGLEHRDYVKVLLKKLEKEST